MKRKILSALLVGIITCSTVACGNNNLNENDNSNIAIGSSKVNLRTAIEDIDMSLGTMVVKGTDNGLYAIGKDTIGEFGIGQEELSDFTLIAKDVETFDFAQNYIDTKGDLYITGMWWGDKTKTEYSKVDSNVYSYCDDFGTYLVALEDGTVSLHMSDGLKYYDEEKIKAFENVTDMLYPFLNFERVGYISTGGDVYILNAEGNFDKLIEGETAQKPYIRNDDIYFFVDDKIYCYGTENGNDEHSLVELDTNVVAFTDGTYTKTDGSIYYATATKGASVLNNLIGLDESDVEEVLYCQLNSATDYRIFIVYKSVDGKLVYSELNMDTFKLDTIEYDYTLEGAQQLYNDMNS